MRVLAITNQFPLPLDMGGPLRFFGLAKAIAKRHDVHMLALARPNTTEALAEELRAELGGPVEVFEAAPARASAAGWLRALTRGIPPWIEDQHSPELARRAAELADEVDVVVLLDDYAGIYGKAVGNRVPVVADKSNVMGWSAAHPAIAPSTPKERAHQAMSVRLVRRFERDAVRRAAAVVVTADEESTRLARLYGRPADAVVHSAIELPAESARNGGGRAIGWLGTHEYEPNVEGLVRFVEDAWQPLGDEGCRLLIAGRDPSPRVVELQRYPGVEVVGFVERLDDFFGQLAAGVVPLWHGPGVKLKTLTFMGAGVPTAATPVGLEGIDAEDGRDCMIAEDPRGLAERLRSIVSDPALAERLASHGRQLVAERYTWESVGRQFVDVLEAVAVR
jgi:glycosyltransferase involved in cell wall biosynthesis